MSQNSALRLATALTVTLPFVAAAGALAQWTPDAGSNNAIADRPNSQVTPKLAACADGSSYVAWFDNANGSYQVWMQRLSASGAEMWPHNGILVSDKPQETSLVDWDLIADSAGNAVVTFTDRRDGTDLDVYAYRVNADSAMMWGADGVAVSVNSDFEAAPKVVETSTGDFVVTWCQLPNSGTGAVRMQRISPAGAIQLPVNGVKIGGNANERPGFNAMVASDNGSVIVCWIRNIAQFTSPRHLHTQKVAADGTVLWNGGTAQVVVHNSSLPIAYTPKILSDGAGGAYYVWHRAAPTLYVSYVQHLDSTGAALLTANGFEVSTEAGVHKIDPVPVYSTELGGLWVAFGRRDSAQSQRGLMLQRISDEGSRELGVNGVELRPTDLVDEQFVRVQNAGADLMLTWFEYPTFGGTSSHILATRVDAAGAAVWGAGTVEACSVMSSKDDPECATGSDGSMLLVWSDERADANNVYGQRINADGTLGYAEQANPGDFNNDGHVDGADLGSLLGSWGPCAGCPQDLNGDGQVDGADLGTLLGLWGT
jgi:hypothetical protein